MANRIAAARRRLERAIVAEREEVAAARDVPVAEPVPAPVPLRFAVAPRGLRAGDRAAAVGRGVPAVDATDEPDEPDEPGAPAKPGVDEAARALAEELRRANDAYLARVGGFLLRVVAGVALAGSAWAWWRACDDLGGRCGFPAGGLPRAQVLTPVIAVAAVAGLAAAHRRSGGLRAFVIGVDGRFSTSATQALLWTGALAYVLLFLAIAYGWGPPPRPAGATPTAPTISAPSPAPAVDPKGPFENLDVPYLLLLGGPFAAAGLARSSVGRKVEEGSVQKVTSSTTSPTDVLTDDDGRASLLDVQFLVFNLVALVYFVGRFVDQPTALPEMPLELVGLTSLAALTYTTAKVAERNAPVVTSITRKRGAGPIRPGDVVVVRGANFLPPGADSLEHTVALRVRFGTRDVRVVTDPAAGAVTRDRITVAVPADVVPPTVDVSVLTAAGQESEPYALEVAADKPVVTGAYPQPVEPGGTLRLTGRFFTRPGFRDKPSVAFDGVPSEGVGEYDDKHLVVNVPSVLAGPTTAITVRSAGGEESDPAGVPVAPPPHPAGPAPARRR